MGKRILVTATTFPRWKNDTVPSFVFYLSNLLSKKGHKITVLAPHYFAAKKYELINGIKVYRFPYFYPYNLQRLCYDGGILENLRKSALAKVQIPFLFFIQSLYMKKLVKKEKIDLIHAHWVLPQGVSAVLFKKIFRIPYIVSAHAGDVFPVKSLFFKFLSKIALENCDYCTANSSYTKNAVLNTAKIKKIRVIPMGIDFNRFKKSKKSAIKKKFNIKSKAVLFVGRLAEKKGLKYLIIAMKDVLKKFPDAKLIVIGDGQEKDSIIKLIFKTGIAKNVIFAGEIRNKELPDYYAAADVFVGPSIVTKKGDTEGLGIVFLEALASGTCIIGSNVGGIPDIIKNNKTGLLVKQKNSKELASAIIRILSNEKLREKLAVRGRAYIKDKFSWNRIAKEFDDLINGIQ